MWHLLPLGASEVQTSRYILLLVIGLLVAVAGHISRTKTLIALGLLLIVAGTFLFQFEVRAQ
ncbi:MAG TPA: hypothetical protein VF752_16050 [Thermoleophilaceae bacterium]